EVQHLPRRAELVLETRRHRLRVGEVLAEDERVADAHDTTDTRRRGDGVCPRPAHAARVRGHVGGPETGAELPAERPRVAVDVARRGLPARPCVLRAPSELAPEAHRERPGWMELEH